MKSVIFFAYMNARFQPHIFSLDYERSLRAAFLKEEFADLTRRVFPSDADLVATFKVPFLIIIKTADQALPTALSERLKSMRKALKPRYRRDLDDLRSFFRLGGLRHDPFA